MQLELGLPSIGGKDSMSGTFRSIDVPPTLVAFGITTVDARRVISPEWKQAGSYLYLIEHCPTESLMPDTEQLKRNFGFVSDAIGCGTIRSAWAVGFGGIAEALAKMSFGNGIGAEVEIDEGGFSATPTVPSWSRAPRPWSTPMPSLWAAPSPRRP